MTGTFRIASWHGIQVAVKTLGEEVFSDDDKVEAFRDEIALLQKICMPSKCCLIFGCYNPKQSNDDCHGIFTQGYSSFYIHHNKEKFTF
nr:hypothetical protein CFP56_63810 [Quercus suber]